MTLVMMQKILQLDTIANNSLEVLNNDIWRLKKDYDSVNVRFNDSKIVGHILLIPVEYAEEMNND